jgi:pilus assembly protein TadC
VDDLSSLAAMLIQTDKFGTSVARSLRVHSDTLRTKRRPAGGRSRGQDRREDGISAGVLHLSGDLGR